MFVSTFYGSFRSIGIFLIKTETTFFENAPNFVLASKILKISMVVQPDWLLFQPMASFWDVNEAGLNSTAPVTKSWRTQKLLS